MISILTALIGAYIVIKPESYADISYFKAEKGRGKTEVRAIMGGTFVGLGVAPLILFNSPVVFSFLGIVYLFVALTRLVSLFVDKSFGFTNIMILLVEVTFGLIMVIP